MVTVTKFVVTNLCKGNAKKINALVLVRPHGHLTALKQAGSLSGAPQALPLVLAPAGRGYDQMLCKYGIDHFKQIVERLGQTTVFSLHHISLEEGDPVSENLARSPPGRLHSPKPTAALDFDFESTNEHLPAAETSEEAGANVALPFFRESFFFRVVSVHPERLHVPSTGPKIRGQAALAIVPVTVLGYHIPSDGLRYVEVTLLSLISQVWENRVRAPYA